MTEKNYRCVKSFFENHNLHYKLLNLLYKFLPAVIFVSYIIFVIFSAFTYGFTNMVFLKITLVPFFTFAIVSVFRKIFNAERPYEKYGITPTIAKDKKGQSFPSRHVASGFVISMAFLYVNGTLGIISFIIAVIIALTRVLSGVHFIRDVAIGALFSLIVGIIFIFIL